MQAKVHQQEGKEYDPSTWIDPESVATTILMALDLPRDAEINDLTVRPGADGPAGAVSTVALRTDAERCTGTDAKASRPGCDVR